MKAGSLNRRIEIQENKAEFDEYGDPLPSTWKKVAKVWADVKILSGLESIKSGVDVSVVKASIRIRYRDDINAGMRVIYKDMVFDIRAVLPDVSGRIYLDLICQSGENQG